MLNKKYVFFSILTLILIISAGISYAGIDLNFSESEVDIIDPTTIRIKHITAPCCPGKYWIDFRWDTESLILIPVNAGAEEQYNTSVEGGWLVSLDKNCNGVDLSAYWVFNGDGSILSNTGSTATWLLDNNNITITFGTTIYTGTIDLTNNTMSGTYNSGCWSAQKANPSPEKNWSFNVVQTKSEYNVNLHSRSNYTFEITFTPVNGTPFVCVSLDFNFIQNNNVFDLENSYILLDSDTAYISFISGWDGCDYIYPGQTVTGTISGIPLWFDFNSKFTIGIGSDYIILEPDGTTHK